VVDEAGPVGADVQTAACERYVWGVSISCPQRNHAMRRATLQAASAGAIFNGIVDRKHIMPDDLYEAFTDDLVNKRPLNGSTEAVPVERVGRDPSPPEVRRLPPVSRVPL
jgi:hypothetical protein